MNNINENYQEFSKAQMEIVNSLNSLKGLLDEKGKATVRAKIQEHIRENKGFEALFNKINI